MNASAEVQDPRVNGGQRPSTVFSFYSLSLPPQHTPHTGCPVSMSSPHVLLIAGKWPPPSLTRPDALLSSLPHSITSASGDHSLSTHCVQGNADIEMKSLGLHFRAHMPLGEGTAN